MGSHPSHPLALWLLLPSLRCSPQWGWYRRLSCSPKENRHTYSPGLTPLLSSSSTPTPTFSLSLSLSHSLLGRPEQSGVELEQTTDQRRSASTGSSLSLDCRPLLRQSRVGPVRLTHASAANGFSLPCPLAVLAGRHETLSDLTLISTLIRSLSRSLLLDSCHRFSPPTCLRHFFPLWYVKSFTPVTPR